jgi:hypothetical protein
MAQEVKIPGTDATAKIRNLWAVSIYRGFRRVQAAQRLSGVEQLNGWIGLILFLVFSPALNA